MEFTLPDHLEEGKPTTNPSPMEVPGHQEEGKPPTKPPPESDEDEEEGVIYRPPSWNCFWNDPEYVSSSDEESEGEPQDEEMEYDEDKKPVAIE